MKVYPEIKTPKSKLHCYTFKKCITCGSIHLYRKYTGKNIYVCRIRESWEGQSDLFSYVIFNGSNKL